MKKSTMGYALRIEDSERVSLITTRTRDSRLWFVNNPELLRAIRAYLALYAFRYRVVVYAFVIIGNHYHLLARFPHGNRASFVRDFNRAIQRAVCKYVPSYPGGSLWARRYSEEWVPRAEDIKDRFFYCALQAVNAGLCERIEEYPGYNSFFAAVSDREEVFSFFDKAAFLKAKGLDSNARQKDFIRKYILKFTPLPGMEALSQKDRFQALTTELEERRIKILGEKKREGKMKVVGRKKLLSVTPGSKSKESKSSSRYSLRPKVLTLCSETRRQCLDIYFRTVETYRHAVSWLRRGKLDVSFPLGTYRPSFILTI